MMKIIINPFEATDIIEKNTGVNYNINSDSKKLQKIINEIEFTIQVCKGNDISCHNFIEAEYKSTDLELEVCPRYQKYTTTSYDKETNILFVFPYYENCDKYLDIMLTKEDMDKISKSLDIKFIPSNNFNNCFTTYKRIIKNKIHYDLNVFITNDKDTSHFYYNKITTGACIDELLFITNNTIIGIENDTCGEYHLSKMFKDIKFRDYTNEEELLNTLNEKYKFISVRGKLIKCKFIKGYCVEEKCDYKICGIHIDELTENTIWVPEALSESKFENME